MKYFDKDGNIQKLTKEDILKMAVEITDIKYVLEVSFFLPSQSKWSNWEQTASISNKDKFDEYWKFCKENASGDTRYRSFEAITVKGNYKYAS